MEKLSSLLKVAQQADENSENTSEPTELLSALSIKCFILSLLAAYQNDHVLLMCTVKQLPYFTQEVATFQSRRVILLIATVVVTAKGKLSCLPFIISLTLCP